MHKVATAASWAGGRCLGARGEVCRLLIVVVTAQTQKRTILKKVGLLLAEHPKTQGLKVFIAKKSI